VLPKFSCRRPRQLAAKMHATDIMNLPAGGYSIGGWKSTCKLGVMIWIQSSGMQLRNRLYMQMICKCLPSYCPPTYLSTYIIGGYRVQPPMATDLYMLTQPTLICLLVIPHAPIIHASDPSSAIMTAHRQCTCLLSPTCISCLTYYV
jgi:hypothetical protein